MKAKLAPSSFRLQTAREAQCNCPKCLAEEVHSSIFGAQLIDIFFIFGGNTPVYYTFYIFYAIFHYLKIAFLMPIFSSLPSVAWKCCDGASGR